MTRPRVAKAALRRYALSLRGAWEDHPWGEDVAKVGPKVFVFFGRPEGIALMVGVKLPSSLLFARSRPFYAPMGYGMDRSGWITARFREEDDVPLELLKEWIEESYRAIAPKKVSRGLEPAPRTTTRRKPGR
jgi:predicted DNA-binding protein (MmcQ/YjbR family)